MKNGESMDTDLRAWPLFASLSEADAKRHGSLFRTQQYDPGETLYTEGEPARYVYLIRRGRVKVTRTSHDGKDLIIGFFGRGDFVGCCCLLEAVKLPCAASAVRPTEVLCLPQKDYFALLHEHPELAIKALQEVTKKLRVAHHKMKNLALDLVERRVVAAVLELSDRFGAELEIGSRVIRCRVTRLELAQMAGTTLESASRTMSKLRRAGWIRSSKEGIVLLDRDALLRFSA